MRTNPLKSFTPAPAGFQRAVLVDVVDKGLVESTWQGNTRQRHVVQLRWQSELVDPGTGKPYLIVASYTNSLDPKATLRTHLESWFGRELNDDELTNGVDLEALVGLTCGIMVAHKKGDKGTFANVMAVAVDRGGQELRPDGYVREADRPKDKAQRPAAAPLEQTEADYAGDPAGDDIPF